MPVGPAFKNQPAGGSPKLAVEGSQAVFAKFVQLVRASLELRAFTVRAWDNPPEDQQPPGTDGKPWVRFTPSPGPSRIYCRTGAGVVHRMPLMITVELSTPGTLVGQSQAAWGAILRAIFPGSTVDAGLRSLGVSRVEVQQPGWGSPVSTEKGKEADRCEGLGKLELLMSFTTPE